MIDAPPDVKMKGPGRIDMDSFWAKAEEKKIKIPAKVMQQRQTAESPKSKKQVEVVETMSASMEEAICVEEMAVRDSVKMAAPSMGMYLSFFVSNCII